jgi:hypothetical protein
MKPDGAVPLDANGGYNQWLHFAPWPGAHLIVGFIAAAATAMGDW